MITSDCPRCEAPSASVEAREGGSLRCAQCRLVFDPLRARSKNKSLGATTTELVAPDGFEATLTRAGLTSSYRDGVAGEAELSIVHRWSRPGHVREVALVVFIIVAVMLPAIGTKAGAPAAFFAMVGAICVVGGYALMANRLNTTRVSVRSGTLTIEHGPIPWPGNVTIDAASITQLYCQVEPHRHASGAEVYRVLALIRGRESPIVLVSSLELANHALFLEHAIERALGIEDRPVVGELAMKKLP